MGKFKNVGGGGTRQTDRRKKKGYKKLSSLERAKIIEILISFPFPAAYYKVHQVALPYLFSFQLYQGVIFLSTSSSTLVIFEIIWGVNLGSGTPPPTGMIKIAPQIPLDKLGIHSLYGTWKKYLDPPWYNPIISRCSSCTHQEYSLHILTYWYIYLPIYSMFSVCVFSFMIYNEVWDYQISVISIAQFFSR